MRSCPKAVHRAFYFPFFPLHSFPMHALNSSHSRQSPSMLHPYCLRSMHACPCLVPEPRLLFCSKFGGEISGTRVERGAADRSTKPPSRSATAILYALRNMLMPRGFHIALRLETKLLLLARLLVFFFFFFASRLRRSLYSMLKRLSRFSTFSSTSLWTQPHDRLLI